MRFLTRPIDLSCLALSALLLTSTWGFPSPNLRPAAAQESPAEAPSADVEARLAEADRLLEQGLQQVEVSQFREALQSYQQALAIYREPDVQSMFPQESRLGEGRTLGNLGNAYAHLGQYQQAIHLHEQVLVIFHEIGDRQREGAVLGNLGSTYAHLGQYQQAIDFYEQQLAITREIGDRQREGTALWSLGSAYANLGQYQQAIDLYEQQLVIFREIGDQRREGTALWGLGSAYANLGQYQQAIALYEQQLAITREIGDRLGEGNALGNLGLTYDNLGQYQQAIALYEQQLRIALEIGDRHLEGIALGNFGNTYLNLGQYQQAIDLYKQQLGIAREVGDRLGEGWALGGLGIAYANLEQYQQAIDLFEQHLAIARQIGNRRSEGRTLGSLGNAYLNLGQYQQAIDLYKQGLVIFREIGERQGEATALGNVGLAHAHLERYQQAIERFHQALAIAQEIGDRSGEGLWLGNIGGLLAQQDQIELAIIFYKQSVNVREAIRDDIRGLPQDQQQSFTDTVADDYRALADLLLQQNRVLEAQRVLDLLKVQELDDYLHDVRSTAQTQSGVELFDPETAISNQAIVIGRKLAELRAIPFAQLSNEQKQQLAELDEAQRAIITDFQGFIESPEIQRLVAQLSPDAEEQDLLAELDEFINLQNNLREIGEHTVLIYPLILDDRLELVLITPFSEPSRYTVEVERAELNQAIVAFRQALQTPQSNASSAARQLYDWLIAPMAADLDAIGAETILYAPDGTLRYIPLAALHNGDQWLVERFRINHITAASLQDFNLRPDPQPQILAAAFSEGSVEVQVGDRIFPFDGLPFAGAEVENLAVVFPGTTQLLDDEFSRAATEPIMDSHTIVHLATHAAFVQGSPSDSFILLGNGEYITLEEIKSWRGRFNQVDLFVLSACETGLGGQAFGNFRSSDRPSDREDLGNGEEILGFGYLMQEAGAEAAIASLWQVSDGGTQALMSAFYQALQQPTITKAEALRQAQIALITGNDEAVADDERSIVRWDETVHDNLPDDVVNRLSHPYYWAPFIIIGNGL